MANLTIVATIKVAADKVDLVRDELLKLIETTRAEAGCIRYDLHRDDRDPACFLFFEIWESRDLWQEHMKAPHLAAYMAATEGAVEAFDLKEMTKIG